MLTHGSVKADPLQALHCQTAPTLLPQNDGDLKNIVNAISNQLFIVTMTA
jgi:hypothetical protein